MRNNSTAMAATGASCCLFALWRGQSGLDANPLTFLQRRQRYRLRSAYMLVLHCKQIGVLVRFIWTLFSHKVDIIWL